jgi:uncharacterized protein YdeI (YjbR/CyaY-like superfamily)
MEITEVFYPLKRQEWRDWLETHHASGKTEVWVRTFAKATGKPCISYDEMVEECLCFGWIDGTVKKYDEESNVRRITPRRKKSFLSELNRQRIWKLQVLGKMTEAGIAPIRSQIGVDGEPFDLPENIAEALQEADVLTPFLAFPYHYKRLKIGWLQETTRPDEHLKRLKYLIRMTSQGKMYGTQPMLDLM